MTANTHDYNCAMVEYYAELAASHYEISVGMLCSSAMKGQRPLPWRHEFILRHQETAANFASVARQYRYRIAAGHTWALVKLEIYGGHYHGPY